MKIIHYNEIEKNIKTILKTNDLCIVLKNDAYGFKMDKIIAIASRYGVKQFAVNKIEEGILAREYTNEKIILFGEAKSYKKDLIKHNIMPTAISFEDINYYTKNKIYFALEIDCGMNRFGIKAYEPDLFTNPYLDTVYVHFYKDLISNKDIINHISNICLKHNKNFHFGGSLLYGKTEYPLRIGRILYKNAVSFLGRVCAIKEVKSKETVGYEAEYTALTSHKIAILDVGYYNGLDLHFDGDTYLNQKRYKVIGRICMNHTFVYIDDNVKVGDLMEFYGKNIPLNEFLLHNKMSEYESFLFIR